jgi:cell wall-associated NlpC family hydrolase
MDHGESGAAAMTYVDGLAGVLAQVSQIQATLASGPSALPGGFESVLAQVSSVPQAMGAPLPVAPDLSDSYGWPLEEGAAVFAPGPVAPGGQPGAPRVKIYDERTESLASPATGAPDDLGSSGAMISSGPGAQAGLSGPSGAPGLVGSSGGPGQAATSSAAIGQAVVADAQKFLGVPYVWGGTSPTQGVDCSGLVQDVYAEVGISLPRTSQEQATTGVPVANLADAQPGDLVFFPGTDGTASAPGHVGIYIGNGEMIDAPFTGADVRVDPVGDPTAIRRVTGPAVQTTAVQGTAVPYTASTTPGPSSADDADFARAAAAYGVPESLLRAVAGAESGFQPGAVSSAGAEGLMQLMPSVASSLGVNPFDPGQAIAAAARLLSSYHGQFGSWALALAAYNAGPGAVEEYSGVPPYAQTTAYVSSVLTNAGMAD